MGVGFLAGVLETVSRERGYDLRWFDDFQRSGYVAFPGGGRCHFRGCAFDINPLGAAQIARDKDYCARALSRAGLNVVEGALTISPRLKEKLDRFNPEAGAAWRPFQDALEAAERFGYPVYVKPNDGSEGEGVAKVADAARLTAHLETLFQRFDHALVQPVKAGSDYRVVVLDGEVMCAYQRRPLAVEGDGARSIAALLEDRARALEGQGRRIRVDAAAPAVASALEAQGRAPGDVPARGEIVVASPAANLSTGGEIVDRTAEMAAEYAETCRRAVGAIGLRFAGVDLICRDIARFDPDHAILEINAAPGLHNYGAASAQGAQTARRIYDRLLQAVAASAPPACAGGNG